MSDPNPLDEKLQRIGTIQNGDGHLLILEHEGRFYWIICGYDGDGFQEIPESLFRELQKFQAVGKTC